MDQKRTELQAEYDTLTRKLQDSGVFATLEGQKTAKRQAEIGDTLELFREHASLQQAANETQELADEPDELGELARAELPEITAKLNIAREKLEAALLPRDPRDERPAIMEIRAGAGGDEASLFAGELYRMYSRYGENRRWRLELINESPSDVGGFKEIVFRVVNTGSYGQLKFESGVHRVQRVPKTESGGRLHTSTVTVAVLPEAEETDIAINPADLRIDVFRSSGPGGQSVNTTDSAVRITHVPSGVIVTCQDEKSQHKNKAKALSVLRSRLLATQIEKEQAEQSRQRTSQIGSGDRSEKIRTYNFPQDRLSDHRINQNWHNLPGIMEGSLDEIIAALHQADLELKKQA